MKRCFNLKLFLLILWLLLSFNLQAQDVTDNIHVETAGTLNSLIPDSTKYLITDLNLSGKLNGTDIKFIREMAGYNTEGRLIKLNLADVNLVAGGDSYISMNEQYYTKNNSISGYLFSGLNKLTSIVLPNSVTSIETAAFQGCEGLTSITVPNSVTSIGGSEDGNGPFAYCTGLTSVTLSNSITSINRGTFEGCIRLTSITIPNSVTFIDSFAFLYCKGLTSITIPNSVTLMGESVFYNCPGLKEIHSKNIVPPTTVDKTFFDLDKKTCKVYVPKGSSTAYSESAGWKDFTNIEEESTAIPFTKANSINVYTEHGAIIVTGAKLGENISIYTESGALLQRTIVTDHIIRINVSNGHTYLIKTKGKTFKVLL